MIILKLTMPIKNIQQSYSMFQYIIRGKKMSARCDFIFEHVIFSTLNSFKIRSISYISSHLYPILQHQLN